MQGYQNVEWIMYTTTYKFLLKFANQKKEQLIFMTTDVEKAFDKMFQHFIREKLKIDFIKLFYNNIFSKFEINRAHTSKIQIKRSISKDVP